MKDKKQTPSIEDEIHQAILLIDMPENAKAILQDNLLRIFKQRETRLIERAFEAGQNSITKGLPQKEFNAISVQAYIKELEGGE